MRSEADALLRAQQELATLLTAYATLSAAQEGVDESSALHCLLDSKQTLLDQVNARQPATLFHQTYDLHTRLQGAGETALAKQLIESMEANRRRFTETARLEQTAIATVQTKVDELRVAMSQSAQNRQLRQAYRPVSSYTPPRFLDGAL